MGAQAAEVDFEKRFESFEKCFESFFNNMKELKMLRKERAAEMAEVRANLEQIKMKIECIEQRQARSRSELPKREQAEGSGVEGDAVAKEEEGGEGTNQLQKKDDIRLYLQRKKMDFGNPEVKKGGRELKNCKGKWKESASREGEGRGTAYLKRRKRDEG